MSSRRAARAIGEDRPVHESSPRRPGAAIIAVGVALAVGAATATARADAPERAAAPEGRLAWYGLPAAIAGGVGALCLLAAARVEDYQPAIGCALVTTGSLLVSPVVHGEAGNSGRAWLSAGLQLGGLVGSIQVLQHTRRACQGPTGNRIEGCNPEPAYFVLPMVGVAALDSGLLSWRRHRIEPTVAVGGSGAVLGVAGRF